ncbi:MAG: zinc ABC transporter substrate-binding protein [Prochloraceae cyanobacterium]
MRAKLSSALIALWLGVGAIAGCSSTSINNDKASSERLDITVSIPPQKYFVDKIRGDRVLVNIMLSPGASPATYEPKPQQLRALTEVEAYISIGIPFEKAWMERIKSTNPQMLIVNSAKEIKRIPMVAHHHHTEEVHKHEHSQETLDPHIWLSPKEVKTQAKNIYQGLVKLDPNNQAKYKKNLDSFLVEIHTIDGQIRNNLAG